MDEMSNSVVEQVTEDRSLYIRSAAPGETEELTVIENDDDVLVWLRRGELRSMLEVQAREMGVPLAKVITGVVGYGLLALGYDTVDIVVTSLG